MSTARTRETNPETPWLGLRSFSETTQEYFFGRDDEVLELFERVEHKPLTVLFGRSGLGKTSLLEASLIPQLRRAGYLPVSIRLLYAEKDPSLQIQVLAELQARLLGHAAGLPNLPIKDSIFWELFHDPEYGFIEPDGAPRVQPVLIFDQFEEIFTLGENRPKDALSFREALVSIVENRPSAELRKLIEQDPSLVDRFVLQARPCKVLLSLREDYLHQLERWRPVMPSLMENRYELRRLTGRKALLAVYEPGSRRMDKPPIVSRQTAEAIVRFVAGTNLDVPMAEVAVDPPLLSLICEQMNAQRLVEGNEQIERDQLSGRSEDILEKFYNSCFKQAPAGLRELVEDHLLSAEGHRESLGFDSAIRVLERAGNTRSAAESAIRELVNQRLLAVEQRGGARRIELTHDVLTKVAKPSRDQRREREAEELRHQAETREKVTRRRLHMAGIGLVVMAVLLVCTFAASIWAIRKTREADRAKAKAAKERTAEQATARSLGQIRKQRDDLNVLLVQIQRQNAEIQRKNVVLYFGQEARSYEALKNGRVASARQLLGQMVQEKPGWDWYFLKGLCDVEETGFFRALSGHTDTVNRVLSVPGQPVPTLISAGADTTLRLWNAITGKEIKELASHRDLIGLGFTYERRNSDGAIVVARIFPKGPAARNGKLQRNDQILKVAAGEQPLTEAASLPSDQLDKLLEPNDAGRKVRIEISHPGTDAHETVELASEAFTAQVTHASEITCLAVSPDGAHVASADFDGQILLWDIATADVAGGLYTDYRVLDLAFSPNKRWLVTAFQNQKNILFCTKENWNLSKPPRIPEMDKAITAFAFAPDSSLAIATEDGLIHFWDVEKGAEVEHVSFGKEPAHQLAFSPDGLLLAASAWSQIKLFDMHSLSEPPRQISDVSYHFQFAFHPTGRYIATAGSDGVVQVWSVSTGKAVRTLTGHSGAVQTVVFLPDNMTLASGADDHSIRLWNLQRTRQDRYFSYACGVPEVAGVCWSSDGRYLACLGPWEQSNTILDAIDGRILETIPGSIHRTAFLPFQPVLAIADEKFVIRLLDVKTGKPAAGFPEFKGHTARVRSIAFNGDGKKMVSGDEDGNAFVWDVATGTNILLKGHQGAVTAVAFSPDSKWVATSSPSERKIRVWDLEANRLVYELKQKTAGLELCFSPDSRFLLTDESNGCLHLVNLKTGNDETKLTGHNGVIFDAAFSPDGERIVSVGSDGTARLWDTSSGSEVFELDQSKDYTAVAFSRDGLRIAIVNGDRVTTWDAALFSADEGDLDWSFYYARGHYHQLLEDWPQAAADYNHALQLRGDDPMIHDHLAYVYAAQRDFEDAKKECGAISAQAPLEIRKRLLPLLADILLASAVALEEQGDPRGSADQLKKYIEACQQCLQMAKDNYDVEIANDAAWGCTVVPGTATDWKTLVDLMRGAANGNPKEYAYVSTFGAVRYRAGDYEGAIETLKSAMAINPQRSDQEKGTASSDEGPHDRDGTAFDWVFLAMANYQLGRKDDAAKWLNQVQDHLDRFKTDPMFDDPNWSWNWENICQLKVLYQEARKLLESRESRNTASDR